jgi:hypothetical protein
MRIKLIPQPETTEAQAEREIKKNNALGGAARDRWLVAENSFEAN